jgi:hypothetical protein
MFYARPWGCGSAFIVLTLFLLMAACVMSLAFMRFVVR